MWDWGYSGIWNNKICFTRRWKIKLNVLSFVKVIVTGISATLVDKAGRRILLIVRLLFILVLVMLFNNYKYVNRSHLYVQVSSSIMTASSLLVATMFYLQVCIFLRRNLLFSIHHMYYLFQFNIFDILLDNEFISILTFLNKLLCAENRRFYPISPVISCK